MITLDLVQLTALAETALFFSRLQTWTENRCGPIGPTQNGRRKALQPWKCWCTGNVIGSAVKAHYFLRRGTTSSNIVWAFIFTRHKMTMSREGNGPFCHWRPSQKYSWFVLNYSLKNKTFAVFRRMFWWYSLPPLSTTSKASFKHTFTWLCLKSWLFMEHFSTFHLFPLQQDC